MAGPNIHLFPVGDDDLEERLERLKAALGQVSKAGLSVDVTNIDWSD